MFKKLFILILFNFACQAQNIIFDLYGVLFTIPMLEQIKLMGTLPGEYVLKDRKSPLGVEKIFLDILEKVPVDTKYDLSQNCATVKGKRPMSAVMYLWQVGKIDYKTALAAVQTYIQELDNKENSVPVFFSSPIERQIIDRCALAGFDFETRKRMWKPISDGIKLLQECAAEKDLNGQKKHKLFVLSNMDQEMIDHLMAAYPDVFKLFDGIIYSAKTGFLKPHPTVYKELITSFKLDPKDSIFIDDQEENILAAEKLGITGILCKDFKKVRASLRDYLVITSEIRGLSSFAKQHATAIVIAILVFGYIGTRS